MEVQGGEGDNTHAKKNLFGPTCAKWCSGLAGGWGQRCKRACGVLCLLRHVLPRLVRGNRI